MSIFRSFIYNRFLILFQWISAVCLLLALQACPYSSVCCIDTNPQNQVNENYLGKWQGQWVDHSGYKKTVNVDISKIDDYHYELLFHGDFFNHAKAKKCLFGFLKKKKKSLNPAEDTILCSAYASYVNEKELLNISIKGSQYFAEMNFKDGLLSLLPIDEGFSSKVILSDEELRQALEFHYKSHLKPAYDETMCLRDLSRITGP